MTMYTNHRKPGKRTGRHDLKRSCVALVATAMLCNLLTGCEGKENSKYETMSPPAEGWTMQELSSVTYLCDAELASSPTIAALGEEFSYSIDDINDKSEDGEITASLTYNQKYLGIVQFKECYEAEDVSEQSPIRLIMIANPEADVNAPIVINGIELGDTKKEVLRALGDQYKMQTDLYSYFDKETEEEFLQLCFNDSDKLLYVVMTF